MSPDPIFLIAPMEILADTRLTHMQMRVLLSLYSFRRKNTDTVWPTRETLSARCGYAPSVISRVTAQLAELGWLVKDGAGGRGHSTRYQLTVPEHLETVTNPVTVETPETVTKPETVTTAETVTGQETVTDPETVTESVDKRLPNRSLNGDRTGHPSKENRSRTDQEQKNIRASKPRSPVPVVDDVDPDTYRDFLAVRNAKRAPLTATALAGLRREAAKAGMSLQDAMAMCCERGWVSLRSAWPEVQRAVSALPRGGQVGNAAEGDW